MSFFYLLLTGILYSPLSADSMESHLCHIIFLSFYAQEINWHKLIKGLTKKKKKELVYLIQQHLVKVCFENKLYVC